MIKMITRMTIKVPSPMYMRHRYPTRHNSNLIARNRRSPPRCVHWRHRRVFSHRFEPDGRRSTIRRNAGRTSTRTIADREVRSDRRSRRCGRRRCRGADRRARRQSGNRMVCNLRSRDPGVDPGWTPRTGRRRDGVGHSTERHEDGPLQPAVRISTPRRTESAPRGHSRGGYSSSSVTVRRATGRKPVSGRDASLGTGSRSCLAAPASAAMRRP
jgi:hypothetical protein